jgi:hypothetical protein
MVVNSITTYKDMLEKGALLVLDEDRQRIMILPL